jgi:hypothetical protein
MSVYSFLNLGSTPVGNFLASAIMENVPGDSGFVFCGGVTIVLVLTIILAERREIGRWFGAAGNP